MATGPEHYREAEKHIGFAQNSDAPDVEALHLGYAQAHATLALAAATALNDFEGGMGRVDHCGWLDVASADWCVKHQRTLNDEGKCRQCVDHYATKGHSFDLDDVVNVSDPEHEYFGVRGTVVALCDSGQVLIMTGRSGTTLGLPASSLMLHAMFVAQMAAADAAGQAADDRRLLAAELDAAEQQAAKDADGAETVMSSEERYEHDRDDEFRIDAEDDARWAEAAQDGSPF